MILDNMLFLSKQAPQMFWKLNDLCSPYQRLRVCLVNHFQGITLKFRLNVETKMLTKCSENQQAGVNIAEEENIIIRM